MLARMVFLVGPPSGSESVRLAQRRTRRQPSTELYAHAGTALSCRCLLGLRREPSWLKHARAYVSSLFFVFIEHATSDHELAPSNLHGALTPASDYDRIGCGKGALSLTSSTLLRVGSGAAPRASLTARVALAAPARSLLVA